MPMKKLSAAVAAAVLLAAPVVAQAAPIERSSDPATGESELSRSLLWIVLAIGVVVGLILLLDDDDSVSA